MAYTLANLLRDAYMKLGQLNVSTATGGSTTSVVDTKQAGLHDDDAWVDGVMIVLRDAGGLSAAPEGEFSRISAYADATQTFTIDTVTSAVASGDTVGWTNNYYPLQTMVELANAAMRSLGDLLLVDTTSITTAAGQSEYTLPVALKRVRPYRVEIQGKTTDADDNQWSEINGWTYVPATAGSAATLYIPYQPPAGYKLRIWYRGPHPILTTYSSAISETIDPELASLKLVEMALEWQNTRSSGSDEYLLQRLNDARAQVREREALFPPMRGAKKAKLILTGHQKFPEDFRTP